MSIEVRGALIVLVLLVALFVVPLGIDWAWGDKEYTLTDAQQTILDNELIKLQQIEAQKQNQIGYIDAMIGIFAGVNGVPRNMVYSFDEHKFILRDAQDFV